MEVNMDDIATGGRGPDPGTPRQAASQTAGAAAEAAGNVAGTAKEQARQVTSEVSSQARSVAADVRDRVGEQARTQNDRLADGIRRMADELDQMTADRDDSPARAVVSRVADSGRQLADYLAERGPEGVLSEAQDFARRRPGTFLLSAAVAGFVVGRVGKGVLAGGGSSAGASVKPRDDAFTSVPSQATPASSDLGAGYSTGYSTGVAAPDQPLSHSSTAYVATGTGTPLATTESYPEGSSYPDEGRPL
jgi:hypothetical protein